MFVAFDLEQRIPADHPRRPTKAWCDRALSGMSRDFNRASGTAQSCEHPARATAVRGDRVQPAPSVVHRRAPERPAFTPEVFSMNWKRLELHEIVWKFFECVVAEGAP